jgi:hypothetical protein
MNTYERRTEGLTGIGLLIRHLELMQEIYQEQPDRGNALVNDILFVCGSLEDVNLEFKIHIEYVLMGDF